jgi:hypothetical protein
LDPKNILTQEVLLEETNKETIDDKFKEKIIENDL